MAKEHCQNIIATISVKEKEKQVEENVVDDTEFKDNIDKSPKFRCHFIHDKFNDELEEEQMCKLCTMTDAYGA